MLNRDSVKKISIILLLSLQISQLATGVISAMTLDGDVDESEWSSWFTDVGIPEYSTYIFEDDTKVYLGIITDSTTPESAQLEFAFKGAKYDWIILISDVSGIYYRRSKNDPGIGKDYWKGAQLGLPEGVEAVRGTTGYNYSYEISISKELLGAHGEDYPERFKIWLMYTVEGKGRWIWTALDVKGDVNFYHDSREFWWFSYDPSNNDEPNPDVTLFEGDEVPEFTVPEIPLGTMMSLATMILVVYIKSKGTYQKI